MGQRHRALELEGPEATFLLSFNRGVMRRRYFLEAHPLSPRNFFLTGTRMHQQREDITQAGVQKEVMLHEDTGPDAELRNF
jgi:hypothetical protein